MHVSNSRRASSSLSVNSGAIAIDCFLSNAFSRTDSAQITARALGFLVSRLNSGHSASIGPECNERRLPCFATAACGADRRNEEVSGQQLRLHTLGEQIRGWRGAIREALVKESRGCRWSNRRQWSINSRRLQNCGLPNRRQPVGRAFS